MEQKHGKSFPSKKKDTTETNDAGEEDESSSEEEDEEAELVTEALDSEIMATLQAIRNKDPRVYDANVKFYSEFDDAAAADAAAAAESKSKEKPMTLRDYHRQNLMRAAETGKLDTLEDDDEDKPRVKTFDEEQEELKREVIKEMHSAVDSKEDKDVSGDSDSDDDGFLIPKSKSAPLPEEESKTRPTITEDDIANADKDPETFLSNFMAARAWLPSSAGGDPRFKPLESDDEEELARAEKFEEAYNLRFEDPNKINETLTTHDRELVKKYSVRREEVSSRKKKREAEKARKEEEKREKEAERARLRKLKIEQMEEKIAKIKKAAGLKSTDDVLAEDWLKLLDDDFGDDQFEEEMKKRFGEDYYAQKEDALSEEEEEVDDGKGGKKKKVKKPKWDDDIDIKDLIPDFEEEEDPKISLSDLEKELNNDAEGDAAAADSDEEMPDADADSDDAEEGGSKRKSKKDRLREKKSAQRESRKERRKIEALVDQSLSLEPSLLPSTSKKRGSSGFFRYRETSPTSFGLSARDILLAEDRQLNQFAGLKKLAPFRDEAHKLKDKKKLGKKARLREWRKETFGTEDGPSDEAFQEALRKAREGERREREREEEENEGKVDIREGGSKKKRKRSRKH